MADVPVIDTHVHFWDPGRHSYPWLEDLPALNRPCLPANYEKATAGIPIEGLVFIQCEVDATQYRQEARWVAELARAEPRLRGIVPWAPLEQGEAARPALEELAGFPLVKGVRRILQFEDDPGFGLRPDFVRGVQLLPEFGLSFELCIKGDEQFANTLELVRQCPDVSFVLDHIGKPFIKEGVRQPWATHLQELADLPNTRCKVSGLVNEAEWETWDPADLRPYIDQVLESFGFDRVCFGGDWPVCTLASTYARWFEALSQAVAACSGAQQRALFHDNAVAFYRLQG